MINSKSEYKRYLKADKEALHLYQPLGINGVLLRLFGHEVWKFQRILRKTEYYLNCRHSKIDRIYTTYLRYRLHKWQIKLSFSIQPNCFGPGLSLGHPGTIVVDGQARIGANCSIHPDVFIGTNLGSWGKAPKIGDNVCIGAGAKIFGPITIADNIIIGANAVVNKSFIEKGISIAGIPARKIGDKGSSDVWRLENE